MVLVKSGLDWERRTCEFYLDENLNKNLEKFIKIVREKDFDLPMVVSGLPGIGKSNMAISIAKACDPNFAIDNIAFTADEFIKKTNEFPKNSAIILDESFADLNSKVGMSSDYLRIINHLQLIRQRNLFIILVLPNYFDLNKAIAIYRTSFLIVCYGKEFGDRGSFALFDRDKKRILYIKGSKYMNYQASSPNFRGRFTKQRAINEKEYDKIKLAHLISQEENRDRSYKGLATSHRNKLMAYMHHILKIPNTKIAKIIDSTRETVSRNSAPLKDEILTRYRGETLQ